MGILCFFSAFNDTLSFRYKQGYAWNPLTGAILYSSIMLFIVETVSLNTLRNIIFSLFYIFFCYRSFVREYRKRTLMTRINKCIWVQNKNSIIRLLQKDRFSRPINVWKAIHWYYHELPVCTEIYGDLLVELHSNLECLSSLHMISFLSRILAEVFLETIFRCYEL